MTQTQPGAADRYAGRVARHVPGLGDLHRMVALLVAERVPADGRVLVLGAGGGLETKAMAAHCPGWRFIGVDPSAAMIDQAKATLGDDAARVELHEGFVETAPEGRFDAATALLVLHFLSREERVRTLREIVRRLKPKAPFVAVHHSFSRTGADPDRWPRRNAAFLAGPGAIGPASGETVAALRDRLAALAPEEDEAVLREAGLSDVELFYAALTFKGWIAYA